jgi:hypothetical protein
VAEEDAAVNAEEDRSAAVYPFQKRNTTGGEASTAPAEDPPARTSTHAGPRHRWLPWFLVGTVLLATAVVLVAVWRPWGREHDRVTRQLGVGGFSADVPGDWGPWHRPGTDGQTVLAQVDWSGVFLGEPGTRQEAARAARRAPESVVGLYVAGKPLLNARDPVQQGAQIQASLPASTISPPGDRTEIAGRDTSTFDGTLQLASGEVLHLHVYLIEDPTPVLLVFFAPAPVDHAWLPTFHEVAASIRE